MPKISQKTNEQPENLVHLIKKLGYDPFDETWLETDLAVTQREKNWFRFEMENGLLPSDDWEELVKIYNEQNTDTISVPDALNLHKKRTRYSLGSYHIRISGNPSRAEWKKQAREFEEKHRLRAKRMMDWTSERKGKYTLVKVKKPIRFWPGPYFHECLERIPKVFTDANCSKIREGIILRIVSYDPVLKYVRLDFTPDIRKKIKPNEPEDTQPWKKEESDYEFWVAPNQMEEFLEILGSLEKTFRIN